MLIAALFNIGHDFLSVSLDDEQNKDVKNMRTDITNMKKMKIIGIGGNMDEPKG